MSTIIFIATHSQFGCALTARMACNSAQPTSSNYLLGWNQPCLEEHLAEIATSIIKWREISPFLGLTQAEEHEILGAVPPLSVLEQKIAMLRLWKKKKGKAATYNRLCRAFRKSKQLDLEDEMKEILAESNSLVDEEGELKVSLSLVLLINVNDTVCSFSGIFISPNTCICS